MNKRMPAEDYLQQAFDLMTEVESLKIRGKETKEKLKFLEGEMKYVSE